MGSVSKTRSALRSWCAARPEGVRFQDCPPFIRLWIDVLRERSGVDSSPDLQTNEHSEGELEGSTPTRGPQPQSRKPLARLA